jgi:iron complex outermembrane recepter protein
MKKNFFTPILIFFLTLTNIMATPEKNPELLEQRPRTDANIFGHVLDAETGDHVPFVNLIIKGTRIGAMTDASGHYLLTNLPEGRHSLVVQSMGYQTTEVEFEIQANQTIEVDVEIIPTALQLDEIVLTASPTASGFRYQPDAVFIGEALQRRSEVSFGEMLNGQPGVAMRSFGSAPARPVIRGLDGDRILVLENGERMGDISETSADHAISLDPLSASRVEVVRGPASLLYGSSALGGVINLMTTDIPEDWDPGATGVLSLQGASVNNMGAGFGRMSYGSDSWATTARFSFRQGGNIYTPAGELPGTSMRNYDGALGWGVNQPNLNGGLSASFSNQNFEIPEGLDDPDERVEIRAQRQALQGRFGRRIESDFFDRAQLRFNVSRFFQQEIEIETLENGLEEEDIELEYEQYALSSTLTLQHKPRGIFDRGAFGLSLQARHLDVGGDEAYTPGEQRATLGVFTFQEIPLSNMLRLQAGLRFDLQHISALENEMFPNITLSRTAVNYSGSMGLNYRPVQGIEIGGQLARSHRNPIVEELFANGPHLGAGVYEIGDPDLKDEIGHGGDLFFRWTTAITALEVAGFVNYFRNFIIFQPTGEIDDASGYPIFRYEGDEARLMGGEISLKTRIATGLTLTTGLDYVHGQRISDGNNGEYLPVIPPLRFTGELEYDFETGWIGSSVRAVAAQNRVAPEEETTGGYALLGFQAGYRLSLSGRHVVMLRVDNALNTSYRDHLSRIEDRNFPMPGRNFNLAYRWYF